MKFNVVPKVRVNGVEFGMNRDEVRKLLGKATEFYKFDDDNNTTDDFGFCHVFYGDDNKCEAIELFDDDVEIYLNDVLLFPTELHMAKSIVSDFEQDDDGLISYSQSIGIYAPDGEMESILFGKEGYYDEEE